MLDPITRTWKKRTAKRAAKTKRETDARENIWWKDWHSFSLATGGIHRGTRGAILASCVYVCFRVNTTAMNQEPGESRFLRPPSSPSCAVLQSSHCPALHIAYRPPSRCAVVSRQLPQACHPPTLSPPALADGVAECRRWNSTCCQSDAQTPPGFGQD
jgi:hypothetical protein